MTVTRDNATSPHVAQLFQAFNRCCEGSPVDDVIQAAANFMIASINHYAEATEIGPEGAMTMANQIAQALPVHVARHWTCTASPADEEVPINGQ